MNANSPPRLVQKRGMAVNSEAGDPDNDLPADSKVGTGAAIKRNPRRHCPASMNLQHSFHPRERD